MTATDRPMEDEPMSAVADAPTTTRVPRSELASALRLAASFKAPAVHIDLAAMHVTAYAGSIAARVTLDPPAGTGVALVDRVALAKVLACCGPAVDLAVDDAHLTIASGPATYKLPVLLGDDTHDHAFDDPTAPTVIEAPVLREALGRVLPFVSRDDTRPILAVVALCPRRHTLVGTDAYRIAIVRYGDDEGPPDELPVLLIREGAASVHRAIAKRLGQVEIWQTAETVRARVDGIDWSLRRVAGEYPSYENLLPDPKDYTATLKVERDDVLAGCRAALAVSTSRIYNAAPLRLTIGAVCEVHAGVHDGLVSRRLESATADGDALTIGVNPRFLADACKASPVETLTCRLLSPLRPMVIEAARDTYMLMPIRLNV